MSVMTVLLMQTVTPDGLGGPVLRKLWNQFQGTGNLMCQSAYPWV
jgi:hypothetical protein